MAPPLFWHLVLCLLSLGLLGFPVAASSFTLAGSRPTGLHARYTRSLWSLSYDPPAASWSSSPGLFYGSSPFTNETHSSTALDAQPSDSSLTTAVSLSYAGSISTPLSWIPQTSSPLTSNVSVTTTPQAPILTPRPFTSWTSGSALANFSTTIGHPSVSKSPGVTPGLLTPVISSSSAFDYSTWLSPVTPVRSGLNTSGPVITQVLTATTVLNGNSTIVVTLLPPQTTADGSRGTSSSVSVITSTETVNGSNVVTFLPPLTSGDDSPSTGVSFSSSSLQSFIASETTISGSVVATFVPAPTTADSLLSSSELHSVEMTSSATVNGSTIITVLPLQTTDAGSGSSTASPSSTDDAATSSASATTLPAPSEPTPSPTSSTEVMQSGSQSVLSSASSTTVAAIIITPIPIVLSEGEKSSTKDSEKTTGSHSDSVSEDQNGHRFTFHIPVLPGGCWFCPPGPPGFRLPELTLPGIYPPMKPPGPGWTTIPALTIDGDGNPKFAPEPSSDPKVSSPASISATITSASASFTSSSDSASQTVSASGSAARSFVTSFSSSVSSCIATTTEVCSTLTSYGVDTSGSTTATSVASQCSPTIGCSVLATNTASATTSSASSGCWEYEFALDDQAFESEDEQTFQTVDTSADAHGLNHIGSCTFTRMVWESSAMSTLTVPVTINIPTWPAVSDLATESTATQWYAATMASATEGSCPTLTYTVVDSVQSLTASPLMTGVGGVPATYSLDGNKPAVNVDHAYDISLITEFLEFIMESQSDATAYCDSFNDFFIGGGGDTSDDNESRLQDFFEDVAGMSPDPAAVDSVLNDVKEKLLANLGGLRGGSDGTKHVGSTNVTMSDSEKLQVLNEIGAALALINDEGTTSKFNMTNSAIWASWMAIDNLGLDPGCSAVPLPAPTSGSPGWADAYSSYIISKLDQQNTAISNHIGSIVATQGGWFTQTVDSDGNLNLAGRGLEAFKTGYPESKWTMSTDAMLIWQPQPTYNPLGTATCYSLPTDADMTSASQMFASELSALSSAATQTYSEDSMTPSPIACSDGSSTGTCWDYGFATTGAYNSSLTGTPYTYSTWLSSGSSSWSSNPLTPSPSPTQGSPTAPLTFTRSYPTIITRSYPASRSAQATPWETFSAANSSLADSSSSWSPQLNTSSTLNPAFPTLPSTTLAQSGDTSSTLNPAFPTLPSTTDTQSSNSPSSLNPTFPTLPSTTGDWTLSSSDSADASTSAYPTTSNISTVIVTTVSVSASTIVSAVSPPAPWGWFTSLPESSAATSTTSSSESSEPSTTATPPGPAVSNPLNCANAEQGNPLVSFDLDGADKAIDWTCGAFRDLNEDLDEQLGRVSINWGSPYENPIYILIEQTDTLHNCPDFSSKDARGDACQTNLRYVLNTCDTDSNGFHWWKSGGNLTRDCYLWKIVRDEWITELPNDWDHNNAIGVGEDMSDDYRPDSTCEGEDWGICPKCPVTGWQRKCESYGENPNSNYCLCRDPSKSDIFSEVEAQSFNISTPRNSSVFSNTTDLKSLHFPRAQLPFNASLSKTMFEVNATTSSNTSRFNTNAFNGSAIKTALETSTASGSLQCINAPQGPPRLNFELNGANAAITFACQKWAEADPASSYLFNIDWSAPYEDPINLEMLFVGDQGLRSRIRRVAPDCTSMPSSREEFEALCNVNMQYILTTCNTARNNHYWWKSGGAYTNQCWRWSLTRGSFGRLPDGYFHYDAIGADDFTGVPEYFDYRPDSTCTQWQDCQPACPLPGSQMKCRGDESGGPSYCVCKA